MTRPDAERDAASRDMPRLPLIGRREYAALPEAGLTQVLAKIDTGARSSALHAREIQVLEQGPEGRPAVRFLTGGWRGEPERLLVLQLAATRRVRNPGRSQLRPIVTLTLILGGFRIRTPFSLTDRGDMRCPVLLGRRALAARFLVDVRTIHYLGRPSEAPSPGSGDPAP